MSVPHRILSSVESIPVASCEMSFRCCTCITVFLVGTVTKELVSWMRGHESSVFGISVHASGRYAMTTSSDTAQLWDLDTFQRKRKLNIRQSVGIQKVGGKSSSISRTVGVVSC